MAAGQNKPLYYGYIGSLRSTYEKPRLWIGEDLPPVAEFIDPRHGDKGDSGIGLSYRTASPCNLADQYSNPMSVLTLSPQSELMNTAQVLCKLDWK